MESVYIAGKFLEVSYVALELLPLMAVYFDLASIGTKSNLDLFFNSKLYTR